MSKVTESGFSGRTIGEFGPGSPPNKRISEVLKAESVCQATAGPGGARHVGQPPMYCQGGEEVSKEEEREREKRSFETGADEYEYELYWSTLPACTKSVS